MRAVVSCQLWIPGRLPGLNEIIVAKRSVFKGKGSRRVDAYSKLKKKWTNQVKILARDLPSFKWAKIHYKFLEPDRRRDPDNFVGAGMKLVNDGLVAAGVLANKDSWSGVRALSAIWIVDKRNPGVLVTLDGELL